MHLAVTNGGVKCCLDILTVGRKFGSAKLAAAITRGALTLAAFSALLLIAPTSPAQTFQTLYNFCSKAGCTDGGAPYEMALVQGANGDLYGMTTYGGTNNGGTVFKITTAGKLKTLYNFCSKPSCTDGALPYGGLVLATDGSFYGTTTGGAYGYGTVFKITAAGKFKTIYNFCLKQPCTDGATPEAGLIQATNGNFYGTTNSGGANGNGTAFEITASGTLTTLYSFCALEYCADGGDLRSGLIQATDGNFYGTTQTGGSGSYPCGDGTFFQLTPSGTLTTLDVFCLTTGYYPYAAPVQAANGNFYGTTLQGGNGLNGGAGTVYEITPTGSFTSLYTFCLQPGCPEASDYMALTLGTDGNFYGATVVGGTNNEGTIFLITPTGELTTLHTFSGTDGSYPSGTLLLNTNGTFYGTTEGGGNNGKGTIFSIATGLGRFIKTIPTSGAVGTNVTILGTKLKGATAVSFNGTAATFNVISASEITTTVPAGATSGTVTVTTPGGTTLNSYVAFQVP